MYFIFFTKKKHCHKKSSLSDTGLVRTMINVYLNKCYQIKLVFVDLKPFLQKNIFCYHRWHRIAGLKLRQKHLIFFFLEAEFKFKILFDQFILKLTLHVLFGWYSSSGVSRLIEQSWIIVDYKWSRKRSWTWSAI